MCGIIGYTGTRDVTPILLDGLRRLEYRGYDSAGVAVYDAGTHGDRVFIAMEHVEGRTFRDWLRSAEQRRTPDTWREALGLMLQAGAGLAAAHAQGMVHRDFKPANVMVSDDGRVRVLDFGLARRFGESEPSDEARPLLRSDPIESLDSLNSSRSSLALQLTQTGMVMGTPAYMAPEQFFGGRVDSRTDQFSFCVVLYRGLFGVRPFPGESFADLGRSVARGEMREMPKSARIPRAIHNALRRGLSPGREQRYPSMDELLADLERSIGQARRRLLGAAGATAVVVALGGAALLGSTAREAATPCQFSRSSLDSRVTVTVPVPASAQVRRGSASASSTSESSPKSMPLASAWCGLAAAGPSAKISSKAMG